MKTARTAKRPSQAIQAFYIECQAPETSLIKNEEVRLAVLAGLRLVYPSLRNLTTAATLTERNAALLVAAGVCVGVILVVMIILFFGG